MRHSSKKAATLMLAGIVLLSATSFAREVTGKVQAVFHEHVKVTDGWADKVSVTVKPCDNSAQYVTGGYAPGAVSDANALGFLYNDTVQAGRHTVTKSQYMNSVNGHVTLNLDDKNVIHKTTFWGYNYECGTNIGENAITGSAGASTGASATTSTPATSAPATKRRGGFGRIPTGVSVPGVGRFGF